MHSSTSQSTLLTTLLLTLLFTTTTFALPSPNHRQNQKRIILTSPRTHTPISSTTLSQTLSCGEPGTLAYTLASNPSVTLPGSPFAGIPTAPECASHCLSATACLSFSYNQINGSCSLFRDGLGEMGVQKRGGAVFWWDRGCFEMPGDVEGVWDERESVAEKEETMLDAAIDDAIADAITAPPHDGHSALEEARPSQAQQAATVLVARIAKDRARVRQSITLAKVDAAIDDAIVDIITTPSHDEHLALDDAEFYHGTGNHADEDEAPLASLLRSSLLSAPSPAPKAWPYGVGALPADDADAKRAWTWEGKGQATLGNRRARRSIE